MPSPKKNYVHGSTLPTSRMGSITAARKKGELIGMPINGAGIDYQKGKWIDNKGRTFGTASAEDDKINMMKAAKAKRLGGKRA